MTGTLLPAASEFGDWLVEVGRHVGIEHREIADYGFPGFLFVVAVATVFYLSSRD
jgi:hypothetical protein